MTTVYQEAALSMIAKGFWVFPIASGKKSPPIKDWQTEATINPARVFELWPDHSTANVGIMTGSYRFNEALIVIDVDTKQGGVGDAELIRLELEGKEFPDTYVQTTPTGGRHLVFCAHQAVRQGASVLGRNLDIRSSGGYIVAAGSCVDGAYYTGNQSPIAPAPQWLIEACGKANEKSPALPVPAGGHIEADQTTAYQRARDYLINRAPLAFQGDAGDHTTYTVAAKCKDFGLAEELTVVLMDAEWNPRCNPPWPIDELKTKVANAYRYGNSPVGVSAPEAVFAPIVPQAPNAAALNPIAQLNTEYAYLVSGGGQTVLFETTDECGIPKTEWLTIDAFKGKLAAQRITDGNGNASPLTKLWLSSPNRRSYDGVVFSPQQPVPDRFYNVWRGFACEPAETGQHPAVNRFLEHAYENVCQRNSSLYDWLISYFAHLIQKPWEKPLVALVFRGGKGVGKNALIERVGALLGGHFLLASNRRYLIGNFNAHLERVLLFALDEAFWSGDKQAEGVLKDLVTGSRLLIERKGFEPYTVANRARVCVIGNEEWLVPSTADERRFAVFDVGDGRKQDTKYFTEMRVGMEQGGYKHLLTYLQTHPITEDINIAPATLALHDQKVQSLDLIHQWWYESLQDGSIKGCHDSHWPVELSCDQARFALQTYTRQRNVSSRLPDARTFGGMLRKAAPSIDRRRGTTGEDGERPYVYAFHPLAHHRAEWANFIGHKVEWGKE